MSEIYLGCVRIDAQVCKHALALRCALSQRLFKRDPNGVVPNEINPKMLRIGLAFSGMARAI